MPASSVICPILCLALLLNAWRESHTSTMAIPVSVLVTQWESACATTGPPGRKPTVATTSSYHTSVAPGRSIRTPIGTGTPHGARQPDHRDVSNGRGGRYEGAGSGKHDNGCPIDLVVSEVAQRLIG